MLNNKRFAGEESEEEFIFNRWGKIAHMCMDLKFIVQNGTDNITKEDVIHWLQAEKNFKKEYNKLLKRTRELFKRKFRKEKKEKNVEKE